MTPASSASHLEVGGDRVRGEATPRVLPAGQDVDAEDAEHGEDELEQGHHSHQLGHRPEHAHHEMLKPGESRDAPERPQHPKHADRRRRRHPGDALEEGRHHDHEVENVPRVSEVRPPPDHEPLRDDLEHELEREHRGEGALGPVQQRVPPGAVLDRLAHVLRVRVSVYDAPVRQREYDRVQEDDEQDEAVEPGVRDGHEARRSHPAFPAEQVEGVPRVHDPLATKLENGFVFSFFFFFLFTILALLALLALLPFALPAVGRAVYWSVFSVILQWRGVGHLQL